MRMGQIAFGWQAGMMGLAPSWPRWESSTARLVRVRPPHRRRRLHHHPRQHQPLRRLQKVDLFWSGPTSGFIDIYRNGALIATVANDGGSYTDNINRTGRGTYTYRVCVAGTGNCSNQVTVRFGSG